MISVRFEFESSSFDFFVKICGKYNEFTSEENELKE